MLSNLLYLGADKLLMAAGSSVEPFWAMYAVHLNNPVIYSMLEKYRYMHLEKKRSKNCLFREILKTKESTRPYNYFFGIPLDCVRKSEIAFYSESPCKLFEEMVN